VTDSSFRPAARATAAIRARTARSRAARVSATAEFCGPINILTMQALRYTAKALGLRNAQLGEEN
jgi:hypothetical protein